jgi:hypothetical protein
LCTYVDITAVAENRDGDATDVSSGADDDHDDPVDVDVDQLEVLRDVRASTDMLDWKGPGNAERSAVSCEDLATPSLPVNPR